MATVQQIEQQLQAALFAVLPNAAPSQIETFIALISGIAAETAQMTTLLAELLPNATEDQRGDLVSLLLQLIARLLGASSAANRVT